MKSRNIYIAVAALAGLLAGYLIFGGSDGLQGEGIHVHGESESGQMWTCSMHPQIMQAEPGSCPLCGMDLIPVEAGEQTGSPDGIRMTENAMALADIRTLRVGGENGEEGQALRLSGKIVENAEANTVQASFFDGRIEELKANYVGQRISKGQQLATIYSPGLVAAQQELLTAAPLKESQPELYRAVRNKLKNWKLTDAQIENIESSGQVREAFPIYATVSGTVTEVATAEGDYVSAGQPIARLSNLGSVWAELDAYESQLGQLRVGQQVRIVSNAYPGKEYQARISFIDPILDSGTRTVTVRATLSNQEGLFKPGMFIAGYIDASPTGDSGNISIPASAVLWTGERSLVYVKPDPGQPVFEMREVVLGDRVGDNYAVLEGLGAGEEIVAHGAFTVDAAAQLQGKKSMMNRTGGSMGASHSGHAGMSMSTDGGNQASWPPGFREAYPGILQAYLNLKNALVASEPEAAVSAARAMRSALPGGNSEWAAQLRATLQGMSGHLERLLASDGDLERQRAEFQQVSDLLIGLGGTMGSPDAPIYVQFCPMADDFKGAYWISMEEEIRNPYFGDAMLTCGEIRDTWSGTNQ